MEDAGIDDQGASRTAAASAAHGTKPTEPLAEEHAASQRAAAIAAHGSLRAALDAGAIAPTVTATLAELVVLGLLEQHVYTYVGVLGHGSTALGEALRVYESAGVIRFAALRHETEAAHAASALRIATGERAAVVTSIGPGALHAFAGSLTSALNGIGVWHIYGDATTEAEGPNMQDLPRGEQSQWQRLTSTMGAGYSLHTPQAITHALQQGAAAVDDPYRPGPFFLLLPINTQPAVVADFNLRRLPSGGGVRLGAADTGQIRQAARTLRTGRRIVVKVGGGARRLGPLLERFLAAVDGVAVLSPNSIGVLHPDHPRNMAVGGSKGSICGNFAMEHADTLVVLAARAVCQSDCSRTGYPNVTSVVNINADAATASHYQNTVALVGDLERTLQGLCDELEHLAADRSDNADTKDDKQDDRASEATTEPGEQGDGSGWLEECTTARAEWERYLKERTEPVLLKDERWRRGVLSQASALSVIEDWAKRHGAFRWFDAGDVQATAFQVSRDDSPDSSFTDGGASYMGFAASALMATALSSEAPYSLAVVGDGSFLMNPQSLIDGVVHGARGAVVVLDNRRMGAISALQEAQYGIAYATFDDAEIDYVALASAIDGVLAASADGGAESLVAALDRVFAHGGVGLVHVPVYYGDDPAGSVGAFGRWNVGNWVQDTQTLRQQMSL